ncbi:hypothetical protein CALCODRAFT_249272 [Calocera cornea HHB12733]|uniref:Uncharacterized protein n=1 Tax=Calocera cornea HHB12733 TaxID=1353952 RepID=A0A165JW42_9BASI|nr:hypothetical protein CALCODRAFT_249272 [Calocera cornea HHB12733]
MRRTLPRLIEAGNMLRAVSVPRTRSAALAYRALSTSVCPIPSIPSLYYTLTLPPGPPATGSPHLHLSRALFPTTAARRPRAHAPNALGPARRPDHAAAREGVRPARLAPYDGGGEAPPACGGRAGQRALAPRLGVGARTAPPPAGASRPPAARKTAARLPPPFPVPALLAAQRAPAHAPPARPARAGAPLARLARLCAPLPRAPHPLRRRRARPRAHHEHGALAAGERPAHAGAEPAEHARADHPGQRPGGAGERGGAAAAGELRGRRGRLCDAHGNARGGQARQGPRGADGRRLGR